MQKELTNAGPLLNERGELHEAGYARRLIKAYDRRAIKAAAHRIKEWDYYLIMNGRWGVALRVAVHEGRLYSQSKVVGNVELGERCVHVGIDDGESVNANHHKHTPMSRQRR